MFIFTVHCWHENPSSQREKKNPQNYISIKVMTLQVSSVNDKQHLAPYANQTTHSPARMTSTRLDTLLGEKFHLCRKMVAVLINSFKSTHADGDDEKNYSLTEWLINARCRGRGYLIITKSHDRGMSGVCTCARNSVASLKPFLWHALLILIHILFFWILNIFILVGNY